MSGLHLSQRYKDWLFIQGEEHKEQSDDLISRQAVIDACEQSIGILEAVDRIMDLPSVEQEPKTDVLDKIRDEIRKHCERYMDGDIIADEVIQAVENICKAESEEV
jgi:predicted DNA-binding protein YlxM (UPF0122 family)